MMDDSVKMEAVATSISQREFFLQKRNLNLVEKCFCGSKYCQAHAYRSLLENPLEKVSIIFFL